jgi:transcription elongation GreA/GreB family factor
MSSAFVKEPEGGEAFEDLPDRPISPHPNFVTPEFLAWMETELERLHREHAAAQEADDKPNLARTARDLRYWTARRNSAQVVERPSDASQVHFGSTVTIEREDGRRQIFRIVGEDEANPAKGTISYVSPVAQALTGKRVGDVVQAGASQAEIVAIS